MLYYTNHFHIIVYLSILPSVLLGWASEKQSLAGKNNAAVVYRSFPKTTGGLLANSGEREKRKPFLCVHVNVFVHNCRQIVTAQSVLKLWKKKWGEL